MIIMIITFWLTIVGTIYIAGEIGDEIDRWRVAKAYLLFHKIDEEIEKETKRIPKETQRTRNLCEI